MFIFGILKKPTTGKTKSMKTTVRILAITVSLLSSLAVSRAQFTAGDLVVVRVGDGTTTLANSTGPISLLELNTSGTMIGSPISVPSGTGGLQISGTATSEGQLVLNANHTALTLAGYVPPFTGSGSLSGRTAAQAPRGYVTIDYNRNVSATTTLPGSSTYSTDNIRSAFASGTSLWFSGSKNGSPSGVVYYNGTSASSVSNVNSRVLNDFNNNLYYSTGSGVTGIYKYSGLPTTSTASTAVIAGVGARDQILTTLRFHRMDSRCMWPTATSACRNLPSMVRVGPCPIISLIPTRRAARHSA